LLSSLHFVSGIITNSTIHYSTCGELSAFSSSLLLSILDLGLLTFVDNFAHLGGFLSGFFAWLCAVDEAAVWLDVS